MAIELRSKKLLNKVKAQLMTGHSVSHVRDSLAAQGMSASSIEFYLAVAQADSIEDKHGRANWSVAEMKPSRQFQQYQKSTVGSLVEQITEKVRDVVAHLVTVVSR